MITFNKELVIPLCPTVPCRTAFEKQQLNAFSANLYNKAHKQLNIFALTKSEVKRKLTWLLTLSYSDTEELPVAVI